MHDTQKVNEFMSKLDHPLKAGMEAVRAIILQASAKIEETVQWGGPSFQYQEVLATFNPRVKDCVAVIFHQGERLDDKSGLLVKGKKGRAYAKFHTIAEVEANKTGLAKLVTGWVKLMDNTASGAQAHAQPAAKKQPAASKSKKPSAVQNAQARLIGKFLNPLMGALCHNQPTIPKEQPCEKLLFTSSSRWMA